ncbi:MAG: TldD/PmbA family protein [Clostridiales bacterium]|nr:TldD/PmbA family protein [Clostridiales bacterium]
MLKLDVAQAVIAEALKTGGDFAEIFLEDRLNNNLSMLSGRVESVNSRRLHGAGVRVFNGVQGVYVYTNDTSLEGLLACAKRAASAVKAQSGYAAKPLMWQETPTVHFIKEMPDQVKSLRKVEKLKAAQAVLKEYNEIAQASVGYMDSVQRVWIANSEGLFTSDTRVYSRFMVNAIASNGTENQTGSCSPGAMQGFEIFDTRIDPEKVAREAAQQAVTMLHAPMCPAGVMPVVIDNGFGGVIFHEACGHSLEATSVAPGNSEFAGKLGQKIAADCVTAIDDGTIANEWGSENIDDEGTPTTKLVLIENGVLKNYMIDKLNARRMNMPITGSGRRQGYMYAPTSRMRNTYIAAGNDDNDEIIATMGDGLYAKSMGGGSVEPSTGKFNFNVSEGYLVKDGKIVHPVRGASLIGRGSEILLKIDRVGKDMQMAQGMCGSMSGSVPTNVGQPMIRVSSMTVGGR